MPRTAETASFKFNHTMIRVKDPKVSLHFYTEILGMDLLSGEGHECQPTPITFDEKAPEVPSSDFTLYFLGYDHGENLSAEEKENSRFTREGILELTHNHGTESDPSFTGYASGNTEPGRGFGHIAITVGNIEAACERFEKLGVPFKKKLTDGKMKNIAFILDPDGYWVEIVPHFLRV